MNAALNQGIGCVDFKGLAALEEMKQRAGLLGGFLLPSGDRWRSRRVFPSYELSFSNIGFAESLKEIAVESARSLPQQLDERIDELANLQPNWDGEGAKSIKPHVLADVVETLKRLNRQTINFNLPFLVPTFDGYLQIEWRKGTRLLDIEAVDRGWSAVGTSINSRGRRDYFTAEFERNDFTQMIKFYNWLFGDELIWPSL